MPGWRRHEQAALQILANSIPSVDGFVMWGKVSRVLGVRSDDFIQLSGVPLSSPVIACPADCASCRDCPPSNEAAYFSFCDYGVLLRSHPHGKPPESVLIEQLRHLVARLLSASARLAKSSGCKTMAACAYNADPLEK